MIEIKGVTHRFGDRAVLRDLDLVLAERRIAVVGSNGSGKSTFARLLNGLQVPSSGQVLVDGLDTRTAGGTVRRKVGFVFQNPDHQIVYPTVEEDLAFGLKNLKLAKAAIADRVDAVLDRFGLTPFRHHSAHLLSGGQKQLLAIASVLVMNPDIIVFDEPTTLLDLRNARRIARVICDLPQTAIVVSHDLDLVGGFDRVLVFEGGRLAIDDGPSRALARYVALMTQDEA
jgi:biotin transport system ATP-binding protein